MNRYYKIKSSVFSVYPRRRYCIFSGSNNFSEVRQVICDSLFLDRNERNKLIKSYEDLFGSLCGARVAISFGAGRMALYAILEALDIGIGDEIIIPAFTCVVVPNAIIYRGARPVYVDIELKSFNIIASQIERMINRKTKALYAQHTFGVPCDIKTIRCLGIKYGLPVIEDCAHALGAVISDTPIGSQSDVAFYSTDHSKVINTHIGGIAVTNNVALASKLRIIQSKAKKFSCFQTWKVMVSFITEQLLLHPDVMWFGGLIYKILGRLGLLYFFRDELKTKLPDGYPMAGNSVQARIGLMQLRAIDANLLHRRTIAYWLDQKIKWYQLTKEEIDKSAWLRYSFLVRDREEFEARFKKRFELGIWFKSVLSGRSDKFHEVGYTQGQCPNAEFAAKHIVNLPTHPKIRLAYLKETFDNNEVFINDQIIKL